MFHHWTSKQDHRPVSPYARVNGRPPKNDAYARSLAAGFADWRLHIDGMVEVPLCLSLAELRVMPRATQSTLHVCIQGWTYFAFEHGAPLRLRIEHQLGFKMAKWVHRIELVEDFRGIGKGQGGWRDDVLNYYPSDAGI